MAPGSATDSQIRRAFHMKAALQWHPDKCNAPDAADQFRKVKEAFQILSSKTTRREHDAKLDAAQVHVPFPDARPVRPVREPIATFRQLLSDSGKALAVTELKAWSARCGIPWPMGCFERAELLSKLQQEAEGELDRRVRRQDWPELHKADLVAWLEARGCSLKFALEDDAVDKKRLIQLVSGRLAREPCHPCPTARPSSPPACSPHMFGSPTAASRAPSPSASFAPSPSMPSAPSAATSCTVKPSTPTKRARKSKGGFCWAAFWLGARPPAEAKAKPKAKPKAKAQTKKAAAPKNEPAKPAPKRKRCSSSERPSRSRSATAATAATAAAVQGTMATPKETTQEMPQPPVASSTSSSSSSSSSESSQSSETSGDSGSLQVAKAPPQPKRRPRREAASGDRAKLEELRARLEALREAKMEADYPKALPVLKELGTLDEQGRITWKLLQQSRLYSELNRVFWRQQVHGASFGLAGSLLAKWVRRREAAQKSG
ncbi:Dnajb9 [Symbiodinium natans]|uniref:Dnajb9 protein n=1 Tax=Symbiodinium natans TaxID=878477 RepID=A0A812T4B7_9DINO|nr:Dnajb9 [Symbiodinium natans]